jgi:hypothetical protein
MRSVNISFVNRAYTFNPISATVENDAPTNVVITFPNEKLLQAGDFTITGFTINSASWNGPILTLVLSTSVVNTNVLVLTFTPTGRTLNVTNNVSTSPVITITTTLTGDFTIYLEGTRDVTITWPDLSVDTIVLSDMGRITIIKALTGGGDITINNSSVLTFINISYNEITNCVIPFNCINLQYIDIGNNSLTAFIIHSEWVRLRELYLNSNALTESVVNAILVELDVIERLTEIDLGNGTNAIPSGSGLTAYNNLIVKGVDVSVNGYPV